VFCPVLRVPSSLTCTCRSTVEKRIMRSFLLANNAAVLGLLFSCRKTKADVDLVKAFDTTVHLVKRGVFGFRICLKMPKTHQ
jgi:hypothetical protein